MMDAQRSNQAIAVSGCLLHQSLMAVECEAAPAIIKPVVSWALDNHVGLIPWTCPETMFIGVPRPTKGIEKYRDAGLAQSSRQIAEPFAAYLRKQTEGGISILAIVGVSFSPACSARRQAYHANEQGLFIQELDAALRRVGLDIKIIDINRTQPADKIVTELNDLLTQNLL